MSSHELITSGSGRGSDHRDFWSERKDLGSDSGEEKMEPRVKRECGVGGVVVVEWGGSKVRRP